MFTKYHYLFCLIFTSLQVLNCQQSSAQTNTSALNSGYLDKEYSINSEILNEERFYRIYLPYDYYEDTTAYDVMYLLDGPRHFTYVSGIVEYLSRYVKNVPPLIIVDIKQQNRSMDMTPTTVPDNENSGGAEKFSGFLSKELLPHIDASYRTTSQKTVFGYSLSGLFAMYCFFEKPDIFDSYITCSPSLWWDDQLLVKKAEEFFAENPEIDKNFYTCIAEDDRQIVHDCHNRLQQIIQKYNPKNFKCEMPVIPKENHGTITMTGFYYGLTSICK